MKKDWFFLCIFLLDMFFHDFFFHVILPFFFLLFIIISLIYMSPVQLETFNIFLCTLFVNYSISFSWFLVVSNWQRKEYVINYFCSKCRGKRFGLGIKPWYIHRSFIEVHFRWIEEANVKKSLMKKLRRNHRIIYKMVNIF